jgi:stage III sporulation protein AC
LFYSRYKGVGEMDVDLIFKIAAIGILVSILNLVLEKSGREEMGMLTTLAGIVVVLLMVSKQIAGLFEAVKTMFQF